MSDYMDSRELQEEIDDLQGQDELDEQEQEHLDNLLSLKEDTESSGWEYGITFIPEYEFENYAMDYLDDVYDIPDNIRWYIDSEKFAQDMQMDYSSVEFEGETYYYQEA